MNHSAPLQRRTPLRGDPGTAREWRLRSHLAAIERARQHPYRPPTHTPAAVVDRVIARSNRMAQKIGLGPLEYGRCEVCGKPGINTHTRRPNGMGGTKRPETRLASCKVRVCGHGNTSGCHGQIERDRVWAEENGLLVPQSERFPALIPVTLIVGEVLLADNGTYLPVEEAAA